MSTPTSVSEALKDGYTVVDYDEDMDKVVLEKSSGMLSKSELRLPRKSHSKREIKKMAGKN